MIWGEDDTFGRWVQGICGLLLAMFGVILLCASASMERSMHRSYYYADGGGIACLVLGARCLWYAGTGKDNVNRDDFD